MIERLLVKAILTSPFDLKWSVQGLGMLRTYLSPEVRLHIWDDSLRVPGVSPIHDHPWHLDSLIVSGTLRQYRYVVSPFGDEELTMSAIQCGENACTKTEPVLVKVHQTPLETYTPGQTYRQTKDEIHESLADTGTVTLVTRTFEGDRETARVFWRGDGGWVDAAPRPATLVEVRRVTQKALEGF